jgi:hypothetical protein
MRINIYDKWIDTPEGRNRSFRLCKNPIMRLDTQTHSINKIIKRLASRCGERQPGKRFLAVLRDKNYENALEGTGEQIRAFARDCLADEGYMSKKWGRKK